MLRTTRVLLLILPLLAGCSARTSPADLPARDLAGHLSTAGNGVWFRPCGASAGTRWWVTFTGASVSEFAELREALPPGQQRYVRLNAAITDERHVGPGGPALLVRRIMESRLESPPDCPHN